MQQREEFAKATLGPMICDAQSRPGIPEKRNQISRDAAAETGCKLQHLGAHRAAYDDGYCDGQGFQDKIHSAL
jgi:hypothetical protein